MVLDPYFLDGYFHLLKYNIMKYILYGSSLLVGILASSLMQNKYVFYVCAVLDQPLNAQAYCLKEGHLLQVCGNKYYLEIASFENLFLTITTKIFEVISIVIGLYYSNEEDLMHIFRFLYIITDVIGSVGVAFLHSDTEEKFDYIGAQKYLEEEEKKEESKNENNEQNKEDAH